MLDTEYLYSVPMLNAYEHTPIHAHTLLFHCLYTPTLNIGILLSLPAEFQFVDKQN